MVLTCRLTVSSLFLVFLLLLRALFVVSHLLKDVDLQVVDGVHVDLRSRGLDQSIVMKVGPEGGV
jgi:hypothetical protein